ncbi:MAG: sensor histidine kinase [Caldilineaceae bacterium]
MLAGGTIFLVVLLYMSVLFTIAYVGDKRADAGRSMIRNPYVYALSMGVYCTAWTFYGSVGRAASTGVGFLPVYLGPTLMAALWWVILRKIIRITKDNRITSIADFVGSRYGKSTLLAMLVSIIAVVGIVPYISLQLQAVSTSFTSLWTEPGRGIAETTAMFSVRDTAFYAAWVLAAFAILFGTRHLDLTEHHEGLVAAIAFESIVKLVAFLAVGIFVTYGMYDGFGDIFSRAAADPDLRRLLVMGDGVDGSTYASWAWLTMLSMLAILFLPRQFQMQVVENTDERHLGKAIWLFPLYLLLMNIFVLPIAFGGLLYFPRGTVNADAFVLTLPLAQGQSAMALVAFIGGVSAATSMVIVTTVALSTMVSNDLVMPLLLNFPPLRLNQRTDLSGLLLAIRRIAIVAIVMFAYAYERATGETTSLVSIGLISFAAVAQFAPAILGGIYWRDATRTGAAVGLVAGFVIWAYTLALPSLTSPGWIIESLVNHGAFGLAYLRPYALLGVTGLDPVSHSLFWSLFVNAGLFVIVSLLTQPSVIERSQASRFVDVFRLAPEGLPLRRGTASYAALQDLLKRFLGERRTNAALRTYAHRRGLDWETDIVEADADLLQYSEQILAGAIGSASAHVAITSIVHDEALGMDELMRMLDETSQAIAYSRRLEERSRMLEEKSLALETATTELRQANERLLELDVLKDEFISTVTHELRTPLTSIRAFTEILYDNPDLDPARRSEFLAIVLRESERLTRLINQVLDLAKIESGTAEWDLSDVDLRAVVLESVQALHQLFAEHNVALELDLPTQVPTVQADRDRVQQVMINLLSNAIKFADAADGQVAVTLQVDGQQVRVDVADNGPGLDTAAQAVVFDKFRQVADRRSGRPQGTGLGLPISRQIIAHFGGELWVESLPGAGATFSFTLPIPAG